MIEIKVNAKYSADKTKIEVTDVTGWFVEKRNQFRFLFYNRTTGEIFLNRGKDKSWTFDVDPLGVFDLQGYIIEAYSPDMTFVDSGRLVAYDGIPDMTLWISGNNPILAPGVDPQWYSLPKGDMFQTFDDGQALQSSPTAIIVTLVKDDYIPVLPELDITVTPSIDGSEAVIKDITAWAGNRDKYALVIGYSSDNFMDEWNYKVTNPEETQWIIPTPVLKDYTFKAFSLPLWDAAYKYHSYNFVAVPIRDSYQTIVSYRYFKCNGATQVAPLTDLINWQEIGPTIDAEEFNGISGIANNMAIDIHVSFRVLPVVTVSKSGEYKYLITPTKAFIVPVTIKLYTFEQYINNELPSSERIDSSNDPLSIIVPEDNLYIAVLTGNDFSLVAVIYCFDALKAVLKTVLHDILCPVDVLLCSIERKKQFHQRRAFATAVTTSIFLLNGMIHSSEVKAYGVFIMTETRLAELQRANDILKKTLLMYGNYNIELPAKCAGL